MAKKKTDSFEDLSWDDLRTWAGSKIVSRGKSYQQEKLVSKLGVLDNGGLLAWVNGTHRYATKVTIDENGLPESICSCPYGYDCKHGVAVVLEYLEQIKKNKNVPKVAKKDERLSILEKNGWDDDFDDKDDNDSNEISPKKKGKEEISAFLKGKNKFLLTELVLELAEKYPNIAQELTDRKELASGDVKSLVSRLKKDIHNISFEPVWQQYGEYEEYDPNFYEIRIKLETLLNAGHPDEVLKLSEELIELFNRQMEEGYYDEDPCVETDECITVIVKALEQSTMAQADKLEWAVDVVLKDQYDIFNAFEEYLNRKHAKADWNILADQLLKRLNKMKLSSKKDDFHQNLARKRLSDWIIYALANAGRNSEIIPLCEAEAPKTCSYPRLVKYLISEKRYEEAERWIREGISKTEKQWEGIASDLRKSLKEIRTLQKDWVSVATMQAEEFIRYPSEKTFIECQKANVKTKTWPIVREHLLDYLEKGILPWQQKDWPLCKPKQTRVNTSYKKSFPVRDVLIDIAIYEKKPDRVLFWYDQQQEKKNNWMGKGSWVEIGDDKIATAVQEYAPERSVAIWKTIAEGLINQTKPSSYEQAARYLHKAGKIMNCQKKQTDWKNYINSLRIKHARKIRFIEILDQSDSKPIISKKI